MSQSARAIAPTLAIVDGVPTTTSVDVARHFGKPHLRVLAAIRSLIEQLPEEAITNFRYGYYTTPETGDQQHTRYTLTRDGFTLLAMGFTGKRALAFKLAYIDAFNRMESALRAPASAPRAVKPPPAPQLTELGIIRTIRCIVSVGVIGGGFRDFFLRAEQLPFKPGDVVTLAWPPGAQPDQGDGSAPTLARQNLAVRHEEAK